MTINENPYEKVTQFHETFDSRQPSRPTAFTLQMALDRAGFKVEEIVEFLYSVANNDQQQFSSSIASLKNAVDQAVEKINNKEKKVADPLIEQVDALIDLLYFTYGSFYLLGVDPTKLFDIVHEANMGKLFPDGQPHYDPVTHKVLKPAHWEKQYAPEPKIKQEIMRQIQEKNE